MSCCDGRGVGPDEGTKEEDTDVASCGAVVAVDAIIDDAHVSEEDGAVFDAVGVEGSTQTPPDSVCLRGDRTEADEEMETEKARASWHT